MAVTAADYDAIYKARPGKWNTPARDDFAYRAINRYQGQPDSVLDIGCGNGHTIAYLKDLWFGTRFTGIDLSGEAIRLCEQKAPEAQFYKAEFGTVKLPGKFEVVLLMGVAEHFEDITEGLRQAADLLEPEGIIYLEAPNNLAMSGRWQEGWFGSSAQEEWHLFRETWEQKIAEAGLKIAEWLDGNSLAWEFVWILERASDEP